MIPIFEKEKFITMAMLICFCLSIFIRSLLGIMYQRMIHETDNMATTNNKLLKQCKHKFASCFQLNNGMANVPIFVDKFLCRMSVGPFSFSALYHISGQLMLLAIVFSGIGICKSIITGNTLGEILPFYIVSLFQLYLYFSITTIVDIKGKRRILKVNLVDYLENHLSARIDVTKQDMDRLFGEEEREQIVRKEDNFMPDEVMYEGELEELLKEFLSLS